MEEKVLGPYRLLSELGSGGMATVYLAEPTVAVKELVPGDRVALKVLHEHLVTESTFHERFRREAEIGARIRHENVVRTLDVGMAEEGDHQDSFMVMEYVEGQTIRQLVGELGWIPEDLCRHIGREVAKALGAIHAEGIVHRDLKPENIIITSEDVVKVMDLGVALLADQAIRLSLTGQFVGSIFYASPEQIQGGGKDVDTRVDFYQLGVVLYELASGVHPYRDDDLRTSLRRLLTEEPRRVSEVNPRVSPFLEEVIHTLIQKDRERRFQSAAEILDVLTDGEQGEWWGRRAEQIRTETKQPLRRIHIPRETALYGRTDEIEKLRALWAKVTAGAGRALLLEGEAGIGKTRLMDELHEVLARSGDEVHFLYGSYQKGQPSTAAGAYSTAYREHFGAKNLEQALEQYVTVSPLLIPAFAALLRGDPPPEGSEPLTKESLQTVFIDVTRSLAKERPTVVLIEDLHLASEEGRALFAAMAVALSEERVLLAGSTRPGLPEDWVGGMDRQEHFHRMLLSRLPEDDVERMLTDSLGSPRLAEALLGMIFEKSAGKPFYVFEILRGLREGQFLTERFEGTWVTTREIRQIEVPSSVKSLVEARLADLDEDDRRLLDVASCLGFEFDPKLLAPVVGVNRIRLLKRLGFLEKQRGLIRSFGRKYLFDEHPVQEAVYEALDEGKRREYHAALADALEQRESAADTDPAELPGEIAVSICTHLLRGGLPEQAERYLDTSLDHLAAGYLNGSAEELAELALESEGLLTGERRVGILLRRAGHLDMLGWREEEREALTEALGIADEIQDPSMMARIRTRLGWHYSVVSRYARASEVLAEAVLLSQEAADRREEAAATGQLGLAFWRLGRYAEAREKHERALELSENAGDRHGEAEHRGNLGLVYFSFGRFDEAERLLKAARDLGGRRLESAYTRHLADVAFAQGRYGEALEQHERALTLARAIGDRRGEGLAYMSLGLLSRLLGRPLDAVKLLEEARAQFQQLGYKVAEALAIHGIGLHALENGRPEEAAILFGESLSRQRELDCRCGMAESLLSLGRVRGMAGGNGDVRENLTEALGLGVEMGCPHTLALARCYLALYAGEDPDAARAALGEHAYRLSLDNRMEANVAFFRASGDSGHMNAAKELLGRVLEHAPPEWRETMRKNVRLHREILEVTDQA